MNCPICKTDITETSKQYGDIRHPLCASCFLADSWVTDDTAILERLERGMSLNEAMKDVPAELMDELNQEALEFFHELSLAIGQL